MAKCEGTGETCSNLHEQSNAGDVADRHSVALRWRVVTRWVAPALIVAVSACSLAPRHESRRPPETAVPGSSAGGVDLPHLNPAVPSAAVPHGPQDVATVNRLIGEGSAALMKYEFDHAILLFDRALVIDSRSAWALADRGLAYAWKGEREPAREDLDAAEAIDPRNPVIPQGRGLLASLTHNYPEAIADFSSALKLQPQNFILLSWRAEAYHAARANDEALADLNEAIGLSPTWSRPYWLCAKFLLEQGRTNEALKQADAVVSADPSSAWSYMAAADIYRWSGDDAAAMRSLDKAVVTTASAQTYLARASYRAKNDFASRRADAQAALALEPQSISALAMLASTQSDEKQFAAALDTVGKAMALKGETESLLTMRAIVHWQAGDRKDALRDLRAARAKATEPSALNDLCWQLATAGVALDVALSACDAALELQPDAGTHDSRGMVLLRSGRYEDAIKSYDEALKEYPIAESLYGRGIAKHRNGARDAGAADLQAALRMDAHVAAEYADFGIKP